MLDLMKAPRGILKAQVPRGETECAHSFEANSHKGSVNYLLILDPTGDFKNGVARFAGVDLKHGQEFFAPGTIMKNLRTGKVFRIGDGTIVRKNQQKK